MSLFPGQACLKLTIRACAAYDWQSLPNESVIVDVGSGLGHVSLEIASVCPDLTFILEDRSAVLRDAEVVRHCELSRSIS